jgi:hypothetical protein
MPAIVGTVALATPSAIKRGLPIPALAITSNTAIMPVTVPSKPSSGQIATTVLTVPMKARFCCRMAAKSARRI